MGKQRVKFTFEETLVKEPVIYELGHKFKIVTNIRRAEVGETLGWVVLELDGEESEIQSGPVSYTHLTLPTILLV